MTIRVHYRWESLCSNPTMLLSNVADVKQLKALEIYFYSCTILDSLSVGIAYRLNAFKFLAVVFMKFTPLNRILFDFLEKIKSNPFPHEVDFISSSS